MYRQAQQECRMINAELGHVKTIPEFYTEIRKQQEEAHGEHYCQMHEAIKEMWEAGNCTEYMELGTHQGGTASLAFQLPNIKKVQLVDIDMSRYRKFLSPLAYKWCAEKNIELVLKELDSRSLGAIGRCDLLVIDSVHNYGFMQKELEIHGHNVRKFIIAHDTAELMGRKDDQLYRCLTEYAEKNNWKVLMQGVDGPGFTVIGK